ncbi:VOC family protein [Leptothoe sp. LEGE 181152]|uniref:Dioxygenase n=1 Tax=Adonisia turfae CCMR0081 TaxID=2292702 RepID=A0A6M0RJK7_9CYAN|nr:VOC family protein [Adonisia turfae]MDV3351870.1 VOC family protein [Leptothoe sp. LEGE 181152]NEZ56394.1 dioxygenase [Adonisia turfae CCMR0081]
MTNSFHYAFKVKDLDSTRRFYGEILGCREGRSTDSWIDFEFFGHQLSAHVGDVSTNVDYCGNVDGISVPIPHFGCLLSKAQFKYVQQKLEAADIDFIVKPQTRYPGEAAQQSTMFVLDYSGNPLEFKSFEDSSKVYDSSAKVALSY